MPSANSISKLIFCSFRRVIWLLVRCFC